ncbi:Pogo transposable element [Aspergillus affinis]|uniref:Pogo transposable element n=1 Tax=Aspergillus affinis TaxID=1070780 RepID=UPI0022FECAF0|nr:Pogo transposable element [Aspergillus affinis]KAI9041941.1 Pogo transposable element [Aspergillus affinis]
MPPKARQNPGNSAQQEGRILLAICALKKQEIRSIREAARVFHISFETLRRRLNGTTSRSEIRANGHKMTQNEEESLVQWILSLDRRGAPPRPSHIREMANILLAQRGTTPVQSVGENWVTKFIKRQDRLKTRYTRHYDYRRAKCEDPQIIQVWFNCVQITIMQHGIAQEDIYNFDETGFAMGLVATARVVTRADYYGKASLVQPGNREWVTSIECINSTGWALPPCVIFKGKVHIEGWYQDIKLPRDSRIEVSPNGWTTDEISLRWLKNLFIPATTSRTTGIYRLLILDGHGSHLTPQFDQICSENNVIPICMPAHSSHKLQPLGVGCFAPLKKAYGSLVERKARLGINHIDKLDFLKAFPQARERAFQADTIRNSFAGAGLIPFDPDRVFNQLNIQLKTPTPPGSRSINSAPKTPYTTRQLEKQASTVKKLLKTRMQSPSSSLETRINKLIKSHELHLNELILAREEIHELRASHEKKLQKRKHSTRQLAITEGSAIQEGLERFQRENEVDEAQNTLPLDPALSAGRPRVRAPPRCSDCHILGHRRLQCPNRVPK